MNSENGKPGRTNHQRRSYFGPILLITIGLIFLAKNIGLIPGEGWETIWRLWPVLLIVAGVDDLFRREGVAWPILMIGAGIFLLVYYFGPQTDISWTQILQLWPILLIAVGIDVLFKGQSGWVSLLGIILAVLLLGGAIWLAGEGVQVSANYRQISQTLAAEAGRAEYELSQDVGELLIGDGGGTDELISGTVTPDDVVQDLELQGTQLTYTLDDQGPSFFPHTARWDLELNRSLPAVLRINTGVGELKVQIPDLELDALLVNQGVGRILVSLPESSAEEILIKQGVGEIRITLPSQARIAVDAKNGLSRVSFPEGFELDEGYYLSPGADRATADLLITVEQGVGLVVFSYQR